MESQVKVSIVIVSMNNLANLDICLPSIRKYTTDVSYEVFVVAYMFSQENLYSLYEKYPWVKVIVSSEIRGFAENNNLALRKATGEYCFCLNDDTEFEMPVLEQLVDDFGKLPENTAVVSPIIHLTDKHLLEIGRPRMTWKNFILWHLHIGLEKRGFDYTTSLKGLGETYNLSGAVFLIKKNLFEEAGWFDDYYFFTPEDIALGTKLRTMGYSLFVDHDVYVVHYCGGTRGVSKTKTATDPASIKGGMVYFSNDNWLKYALLSIPMTGVICIRMLVSLLLMTKSVRREEAKIRFIGACNSLKAIYSKKSPKQLFTEQYLKLKS